MTYNLAGDISARVGQPVAEDWLRQALGETMAVVRALAPCQVEHWRAVDDLPEDVYRVVVASLARKLANPMEARHQTIGEFSVTLDAGSASGGFTEMERLVIRSVSGCEGPSSSGAYTVSMSPSSPLRPDVLDQAMTL